MVEVWRKYVRCRECGFAKKYIDVEVGEKCPECGSGVTEDKQGVDLWYDYFEILWGVRVSASSWWRPWTWGNTEILWR